MPMVDRICKNNTCRALYCSKSCKAKAQEAKTGANLGHQRLVARIRDGQQGGNFDNAHQFDNTEL